MSDVLLLGTKNRHKVRELADLLDGVSWTVKGLDAFPDVPTPDEDGETFEENALFKARYYSNCHRVACVADDSGLVVDALGGAPGVLSALYAGKHGDDAANNAKLLGELADVPDERRTARFVCCAALALPSGAHHVVRGVVEGRVASVPRGAAGFGYDPLFVPDGYDQTFGELDHRVKQAISHRARAFQALRAYLESLR